MKLRNIVLCLAILGGCSDATSPASLTFEGVGEPTIDPAILNGTAPTDVDVVQPGCETDSDCDASSENPCVVATCSEQGECVESSLDNGALCDDGNTCTGNDSCNDGVCTGGEDLCACESDDDCAGDLFDRCLGTWACQENSCQLIPETEVVCGVADGLCTDILCVPSSGECEYVPREDGAGCDDGNACTVDEVCNGGQCSSVDTLECDDANSCTADSCDAGEGCVYEPIDGGCDDGDACTLDDQCVDGECASSEGLECETDEPCMVAACDPEVGCTSNPAADGSPCEDGNVCTEGDSCDAGICKAGASTCDCETDADCPDDGDLCNGSPVCVANACVIDPKSVVSCDEGTECVDIACNAETGSCDASPVQDGTPCTDAGPCTETPACTQGECVGTPKVCSDANPCTSDTCVPALNDCVFEAQEGECDDAEPCTLGDKCLNGGCVGGSKDLCIDGDACTSDDCTQGVGCEWNGLNCDDGKKCTSDSCAADTGCINTPKVCPDDDVVCVMEMCSEVDGLCQDSVKEGVECDDGDACTTNDACLDNNCQGDFSCDDGNPCTVDSCLDGGCISVEGDVGAPCDDGSACTLGDQCSQGVCQGLAVDCVDDDPCTLESCEAGQCVVEAIPGCEQNIGCDGSSSGKPCNDGDGDTIADVCVQGVCRGFELRRVNGAKKTGHIVYTHTNRAVAHWFLTSSRMDGDAGEEHRIELYDDTNQDPTPQEGSESASAYTGIHQGYASTEGGLLTEFLGQTWSKETPVAVALQESGVDEAKAVWVYRGQDDTQVFVAGKTDGGPALRECSVVDGWCSSVELFMPNNYWYGYTDPKALTGRELCEDGEACFPAVILAGDASNDAGYYNNVHYRDPADQNFYAWYGDWWSGDFQTGDIAAYGDGRYLLNGPEGYVRYFSGADWSNTLDDLKGGTSGLNFTSVWIGADVVVMVANYAISQDKVGAELWVGARNQAAYFNDTWNIYDLGEHKGTQAGFFDVWGAPDGQIRIVGSGIDKGNWQDGLILVRKP
jgi:hypothetical protein